MGRAFGRVLIANRGEIAVRIARAVRAEGAEVVAVYSAADREALHVRFADWAVEIGPAEAQASYLNVAAILAAARASGADAIHPGYGFLSERPALAEACAAAGITFIGPSAHAMRVMGDKASARRAMQAAGVPIVPGNHEALSSETATALAATMGYPVLLKAAAGGGGKGMRLVESAASLPAALLAARSEAQKAFGDDAVYLEKALIAPKHIEVQIFADAHGHVVALGERECSLQRRHQKVVEEAPSAAVDADLRARMQAVACQAARAVDYVGAGTVEFLLDQSGAFYFLEMNTRLQVEHAVTEMVYGLDLVRLQLQVARGEPLGFAQADVVPAGHAVEARLYAEDPARGFLPSAGTAEHVVWPQGPGIRVDAGIASGSAVPSHYDPMVAKVIAWGATRTEAIERLALALRETWIAGVTTNRAFLLEALAEPSFLAGSYHTGTLQHVSPEPAPASAEAEQAAVAALLVARLLADAARGARPHGPAAPAPRARARWQLAAWPLQGL